MNHVAAKLFPLTAGQFSIWTAQSLDRENPNYNLGGFTEIAGALERDALQGAVRRAVRETASLNLAFIETEDGPMQFVAPERPWPFMFVDFSAAPEPENAARSWMREDLAKAIDVLRGPLFRFGLLRLSPFCHFLYVVNHHLVNDGVGGQLMVRRMAEIYRATVAGDEPQAAYFKSIPEILASENDYRASTRYARDRDYFLRHVAGRPAVSLAPQTAAAAGGAASAVTSLEAASDMEALGRRQGASAATVFVAAVAAYLFRQTGETDLLIGLQTAARLGAGLQNVVGAVTNTTPLRIDFEPTATFAELIGVVARKMREALRRQQYRIEDLRRDLAASPAQAELFSAIVNFIPAGAPFSFNGEACRRESMGNWWVSDIMFACYDNGTADARRIQIIGNAARYPAPLLDLHGERFRHLLDQAVRAPTTSCSTLDRMTLSERQRVLADFNGVDADEPREAYVHRYFERAAGAHPVRTALTVGAIDWSYARLNAEANRLARLLKESGVGPDTPVIVCMERSAALVLAILATLKAGGAYVPVDPSDPRQRISLILRDSAARLVLTTPHSRAQVPESLARIVVVDDRQLAMDSYLAADLDDVEAGLTPASLAYVLYTSESTGVPKGVMIEHQALSHRLSWLQRRYGLTGDDGVLLKMPATSDAAALEAIWPLTAGARIVLAAPHGSLDPDEIAKNSVTTLILAPSQLRALLEPDSSIATLRRVICEGEIPADLARTFRRQWPRTELHILYGPTEAAIFVTHAIFQPQPAGDRVPIGRPIDGVQVYILDPQREPVAVGGVGEIYVSGEGMARGYFKRADLTAESFVECPFAPGAAARMYKTGDLGLWRADGAIEYRGRNDDQVKINGVRIEIGEIETQLKSLPDVRDAAVVIDRGQSHKPRIVAFFVPESNADPNAATALARLLSRRIPEQLLPKAFIPLAALPLTTQGTLDRRALSELPVAQVAQPFPPTQALETPTQRALAEIWRDLLGRDDFSAMDNFFDLGGHSLLATRMRSRIRLKFAVDLPLKLVFAEQTLAELAQAVDGASAAQGEGKPEALAPAEPSGSYVLSYSQQRMWLSQSLDLAGTAYNLVGAIRLKGELNVDAVSYAFDELRRRHETLRSVFSDTPAGARQRILPWRSEPVEAMDLRALGAQAWAEALRRAERDARTPFDLAAGPVLRIGLFRVGDKEHLLYIALHHISGDQWSFGVITRDFSAAYNAFCAGRAAELAPLAIAYRDYATWQRSEAQSVGAQAELAYWKRKLDGVPTLDLPTDFPRPRLRTSAGAFVSLPLPLDLLARLERLSRREGVTLFMTMLAAFALHLSRLTGQTDIAISAPIANRTRHEFESLVGTFVNTLVMRIDLSGRPTLRGLLRRVSETALEAYSHQDASFDELVQRVARTRDEGRAPLAQVMFNMLNAPYFGAWLDRVDSEPVLIDRGGAQFELSVSVDPQILNTVVLEYNSDLFARATVERFGAQYVHILEGLSFETSTPISRVALVPRTEMTLLLDTWNATQRPPEQNATFIRMFESQAAARPGAEALRYRDVSLSYRELDAQAENVATHLRGCGVRPGVGVGVCLDRTPLMLQVLLGVQKAGGHYIPLDPASPANRLEYMVADSGLSVLIGSAATLRSLNIAPSVAVLDPETLIVPAPQIGREAGASDRDLAYIIYTSGSTGRPKGVRISQRALANFVTAMRRRPGMDENDTLVAITTISFDISGLELYLPLSVGGRIVLAPSEDAVDGDLIIGLIEDSRATVLQATPATWNMLLDAGWTGAPQLRAFCGGEALSQDLAKALRPRVKELWNLYGPTETTIWSTAARIDADSPICIGTPIDNTRVYIADAEGQLCPIGIAGEIWIAGEGVAEGYQNLPELTAERFLPDPFFKPSAQRLYRTGDLGTWGADGRLYHFGRLDNQIKVRGFRIEPEEVESILRSHPAIRDAVVAARTADDGDVRLVGYVIGRAAPLPTSSELRAHLRKYAPQYMVPQIFVELDKFPLTPNGKIDRRALPYPFGSQTAPTRAAVAPAPGAEQEIAEIWRSVLKVDHVGAHDNFFELGGHSLLALRVAALLKVSTGKRMDPRLLYFQTLRQIAASNAFTEG